MVTDSVRWAYAAPPGPRSHLTLAPAQSAEIRHRPLEADQPQKALDEACGLPEGHAEEDPHRQARLDRGIAILRRLASLAGRRRHPDHVRIEPDRQGAARDNPPVRPSARLGAPPQIRLGSRAVKQFRRFALRLQHPTADRCSALLRYHYYPHSFTVPKGLSPCFRPPHILCCEGLLRRRVHGMFLPCRPAGRQTGPCRARTSRRASPTRRRVLATSSGGAGRAVSSVPAAATLRGGR